jgi:RNA polymerase primary sigma factor
MENADITLERTGLANRCTPQLCKGSDSNSTNIDNGSDLYSNPDRQSITSYIRDVSAFKLLKRDDEVRIAKRIEAGENAVLRALLQTPAAAEHIIRLGRQIEKGAVSARKIVRAVKADADEPADGDDVQQFLNIVRKIKKLHDVNQMLRSRLAAGGLPIERERRMQKAVLRQGRRMAELLRGWRLQSEIIQVMVDKFKGQADRIVALRSNVHQLADLIDAPSEEVMQHMANRSQFMRWTALFSSLPSAERASLYRRFKNAVESMNQIELKLGMKAEKYLRIRQRVEIASRVAQTARDEFVTANLRLVFNIARHYASGKMQLLDCIQEGNLGLIKAVEKFDYHYGFKFSTYATWWIKQAIFRAIDNHSRLIRIPVHMNENLKKIKRAVKATPPEGSFATRADEIAAELNISRDNLDSLLKFDEEPLSLNAPLSDRSGHELGHFISDGDPDGPLDAAITHDAAEKIRKALATLSPREEKILRMRFGIGEAADHTLDEISRDFALTRERIRQIEARALQKLRHPAQLRQLASFMEN